MTPMQPGDFRRRVETRRDPAVSAADHQRALDVARRLDVLLGDIRETHGTPMSPFTRRALGGRLPAKETA